MSTYRMRLPDVGEGVAEAELVQWFVAVGDEVTTESVLAEVLTDKATVEVSSPVAGVVTTLHGEPGDVARGRERSRRDRNSVGEDARRQPDDAATGRRVVSRREPVAAAEDEPSPAPEPAERVVAGEPKPDAAHRRRDRLRRPPCGNGRARWG